MAKPFYDLTDPHLLAWSIVFSDHLTATPTDYGITAAQATAYAALNAAFSDALTLWQNGSTRTPVASANKRAARTALLDGARYLVYSINSNPETTDAQRNALGINARKKPSAIPAPDVSPIIDVIAVRGRVVSIGMHSGATGLRRGKPAGVAGASVFTFVGDEAPADTAAWKFEGLITKTKFDLSFEQSTTANTVWVTAFWYNERGQSGVACAPVSINLPASTVLPQGDKMKIAA